MLPNLLSSSVLRVKFSAVSVFVTFTLNLTSAHTTPSTLLAPVAVGNTSLMETEAVSQVGPTEPLFESVPLTHALSVMDCPALPDTVCVKVQLVEEAGPKEFGFGPRGAK